MATVNIYLTFDGNCEEAFDFYKSVFGNEFARVSKFGDMPDDPKYPVPESEKNKIMQVSLPVSKETLLMGSDKPGRFGSDVIYGNNFSVSVSATKNKQIVFLTNFRLGETFPCLWKLCFGARITECLPINSGLTGW